MTVLDDAGAVVDQWAPPHTEAGLADTLIGLARHGQPDQLPVAIEQSSGLVVDRLLAAGHPVVPVHASAFHAARPRWGAAGAKSDPGDSYKLADYLRTDGHRLRRLDPLDDATRELQALVRLREDHQGQDRRQQPARRSAGCSLARRQAGLLPIGLRDRPGLPGGLSDAAGIPIAAAAAPPSCSPGCAQPQPPPLGLAPETLTELVRAQVRLLRTLLGTIADLDRALAAGLVGHAKARLLASMPRIGEVNLAQIVAEVGPILERVDTVEQAIAECGAAPVTRASGKTRTVGFRWAANRRARTALHAFADNSRHASPWAARLYADARRHGKHHPHAIPDPGPRLASGHVGLLAHQHRLQPRQAWRRTTPRRLNLTQETQTHRRPPALPAPGALRHQPDQQVTHSSHAGDASLPWPRPSSLVSRVVTRGEGAMP